MSYGQHLTLVLHMFIMWRAVFYLATGIPIYESMILTPECPNRPNQMAARNILDALQSVDDALKSVVDALESVDDALESVVDALESVDR